MAADPLAALSLATVVVQFVEFGRTLLADTRSIYNSTTGISSENQELETVYKNLMQLNDKLLGSAGDLTRRRESDGDPQQDPLRTLALSCSETADQLLRTIESLKAKPSRQRRWQSFRHALKSTWNKEKIDRLLARLDNLRSQMSIQLVTILSDQQSNLLREVQNLNLCSKSATDEQRRQLERLTLDIASIQSSHLPSLAAESAVKAADRIAMEISKIQDSKLHDHTIAYPVQIVELLALNVAKIRNSNLQGYTQEESAEIADEISDLKADLITDHFLPLLKTESIVLLQEKILKSLYFDTLPVRYERIAPAYVNTFRWILEPQQSSTVGGSSKNSNLLQWLQSGNGIFWISGKAGSGKSTLMKYLTDHTETQRALRSWADEDNLVVASHFFWIAGTSLQKSHAGLLRSLLFTIFMACPDLISQSSPPRYRSSSPMGYAPWTIKELHETLLRAVALELTRKKFCFFIDGLDEYEGSHAEVNEILISLSKSPNIKICLSSRPWNVFEDYFGQGPQRLRLEDLTKSDIENYVKGNFTLQLGPTEYKAMSEYELESIIQEIVERAQGVFLWVYLVVKSLNVGLSNADSFKVMKSRLKKMPNDLEEFFQRMLGDVEDIYQESMAQTFQVALAASEPLSLITYSFMDEDPEMAFERSTEPMDGLEILQRNKRMQRRLNGRCQGLLEVVVNGRQNPYWDLKVEFLHRTVRDFLCTSELHSQLSTLAGGYFNPHWTTCRAYLAVIKAMPKSSYVHLEDHFKILLAYASLGERETGMSYIELLQAIERFATSLDGVPWRSPHQADLSVTQCESFWEFAIKNGVSLYIIHMVEEGQLPPDFPLDTLLRVTLKSQYTTGTSRLVLALLEKGADPNAQINGSLVFGDQIRTLCTALTRDGNIDDVVKICNSLLEFGANLNGPYQGHTVWEHFVIWTGRRFHRSLPHADVAFQMVETFLHYGAYPDCLHLKEGHLLIRKFIHGKLQPKSTNRLQKLMQYSALWMERMRLFWSVMFPCVSRRRPPTTT